jgi:hypothetical protein
MLIVSGLLGAMFVAVGVPLFFGMLAWDVVKTRSAAAPSPDVEQRISLERGFARGFVIVGGLFWTVATFAGAYSFRQTGMSSALIAAFLPLVATAATLIVGWYFERITAVLLVVASLAVVVWGVVAGFELGVWALVTVALIGPMMTAAVLFWLARRNQEAFELSLAAQRRPEFAPIAPTHGPRF